MNNGSLSGIKVLDLSRILAGPYCSQILSDHGAEIIKIESPTGDETRRWGPPFRDGESAYFFGVNRNKKSVCLDLADTAAQKALGLLLEKADVLLENFKPGTMARKFGLSDETLEQKYPRLVHARITGFGGRGPLGSAVGFDAAIQAWSGLMSITGIDRPTKAAMPIIDLVTGIQAAFAVTAALLERERSGRGQRIETSLYENAIAILHPQMSNYFFSGKVPAFGGNRHPNIAPYDLFETSGVPIYIACGNDQQFVGLCEVLSLEQLAREFPTNAVRMQRLAEFDPALREAIRKSEGLALVEKLLAHGVPAGPVQKLDEMERHPQTRALGIIREFEGRKYVAPPVQFSRSEAGIHQAPPELGEHTDEILSQLALSKEERAHLQKGQT